MLRSENIKVGKMYMTLDKESFRKNSYDTDFANLKLKVISKNQSHVYTRIIGEEHKNFGYPSFLTAEGGRWSALYDLPWVEIKQKSYTYREIMESK